MDSLIMPMHCSTGTVPPPKMMMVSMTMMSVAAAITSWSPPGTLSCMATRLVTLTARLQVQGQRRELGAGGGVWGGVVERDSGGTDRESKGDDAAQPRKPQHKLHLSHARARCAVSVRAACGLVSWRHPLACALRRCVARAPAGEGDTFMLIFLVRNWLTMRESGRMLRARPMRQSTNAPIASATALS